MQKDLCYFSRQWRKNQERKETDRKKKKERARKEIAKKKGWGTPSPLVTPINKKKDLTNKQPTPRTDLTLTTSCVHFCSRN
jgi:hypothetical protein